VFVLADAASVFTIDTTPVDENSDKKNSEAFFTPVYNVFNHFLDQGS
jgi:hypothetical protein